MALYNKLLTNCCAVAKPNGWSHTLSNPTCASRIKALQQEESDLGRFALATTVAGFQILVHKTDDIVSSSLLSQGSWEQDHLKVCSTNARSVFKVFWCSQATMEHHEALDQGPYEKTYLDIGANLGYFSLMAATHGFKVTAFEVSMRGLASHCSIDTFTTLLYQHLYHTVLSTPLPRCFINRCITLLYQRLHTSVPNVIVLASGNATQR